MQLFIKGGLLVILLGMVLQLTITIGVAGENIFGVNTGLIRSENSGFYVDDPVNMWLDRGAGFFVAGQYYKKMSDHSFVGAYAEWERLRLDKETDDGLMTEKIEASGNRFALGLTWVARTGENFSKKVIIEFGGFGGVALASLSNFDSQTGFDFGIFLGPVFPISENMQLGVQVTDSYGWYHGKNPKGMQNVQPRLRVQLYFFR